MDWKDALQSLHDSGSLPPGEEPAQQPAPQKTKKGDLLHISIDRRQRHGKTATIIDGFTADDEELKETARRLKQAIGTGGSCRGGEILLQGDWRDKARELLAAEGYRFKQ